MTVLARISARAFSRSLIASPSDISSSAVPAAQRALRGSRAIATIAMADSQLGRAARRPRRGNASTLYMPVIVPHVRAFIAAGNVN